MSRKDRFLQPVEDIKIVESVDGPRTLLTPEVIDEAAKRVKAGESIEKVALELAHLELDLLGEGLEEVPTVPTEELPEEKE